MKLLSSRLLFPSTLDDCVLIRTEAWTSDIVVAAW